MELHQKVKILKDATETWLELAKSPAINNELFIITPYFTGTVIPEIIEAAKSKRIVFITCLNTNSVLSGSVDLGIVEQLLTKNQDISIYSHPQLHSKLIYNGYSVVVGSQNFTRKGKTNLEASVFIGQDFADQDFLNPMIEETLLGSTSVDLKKLKQLKVLRDKYSIEYENFMKFINKCDDDLDNQSNENLIKNNVVPIGKKKTTLNLKVKKMPFSTAKGNSYYHSLQPHQDNMDFKTLFEANVGKKFNRGYNQKLIYFESNMRICYGDIYKTAISKFALDWGGGGRASIECDPEEYEEEVLHFNVKASSPLETQYFSNLCLTTLTLSGAELHLLFNGSSLKICDAVIPGPKFPMSRRVQKEFSLIEKYLNSRALETILDPSYSYTEEFGDWTERYYPTRFFDVNYEYKAEFIAPIDGSDFLNIRKISS